MRPRRSDAKLPSRIGGSVFFAALLAMLHPGSALATFHLNEIDKVMVGFNGNAQVQAVELKMLANGENQVGGALIRTYDAGGSLVATLGTFSGNLPVGNAIAGRKILCATHAFAVVFGITPDLVINPGLLVGTGQVSFENPPQSCFVNAIAYGSVTTPKDGTTSAPALSTAGATALVRTIDDGTTVVCPLSEDAAARFSVVSGTSGSPVTFTNNSGASVNVFPTATGVDGGTPAPAPFRVYPNPFAAGTKILVPGYGYVAIYDVSGRLVRSWGSRGVTAAAQGSVSIPWDGTDRTGRRLPSGIYFVKYGTQGEKRIPVVLLR